MNIAGFWFAPCYHHCKRKKKLLANNQLQLQGRRYIPEWQVDTLHSKNSTTYLSLYFFFLGNKNGLNG